MPFYASVRLNIRAGEKIKVGDDVIGHFMNVRVVKNKFAVPFKKAVFPLIYGVGVDKIDEVAQMSKLAGLVRQAGAWIRYEDEQGEVIVIDGVEMKFNGHNKFVEALRDTPKLMAALEGTLRGVELEAPDAEVEDEDTIPENQA